MGSETVRGASVNREMGEKSHCSLFICQLSFVIAGGDPDSLTDVHWGISGAMTNDK